MSPILVGSAADTGLKIDSVKGSEPKVCTKCGQSKPLSEFYKYSSSVALTRKIGTHQAQCKDCMRAHHRVWRARHADDPSWVAHQRRVTRTWQVKRLKDYPDWDADHRLMRRFYMYGIPLAEIKRLLEEQGRRCAACRRPFTNVRFERPVIDHDHVTGAIRGLLCSRCNTVLGQAGDGPTVLLALVAYLKRDALNQELRIVGDAG